MSKFKRIITTFLGGLLMGSSASAMNSAPAKKPLETKIQKIMKALHSKKIQGVQSKIIIEYLEKNHNLNSIESVKPEATEEDMNIGNWDTWSNWNTWDTWSNWNTWDTWSNWNTWNTWSNWSNY
jgi:hypothetical protein